MALDDIQFASTGSYSQPSIIVTLPVSGSTGNAVLIEPQTVNYEIRIYPEEISIF